MKQILFTVSVLVFVGTQAFAASTPEEKCKQATAAITEWSYGGASEEFLRNRFATYFAKDTLNPDDTFMSLMEAVYSARAMEKGLGNVKLSELIERALTYNCSAEFKDVYEFWY